MKAKKLLLLSVALIILMSVCIPQYASASGDVGRDAGRAGVTRKVEEPTELGRQGRFERESTTIKDMILGYE